MKFKSYFLSLLAMVALSVGMSACSDDDDEVVTPQPKPEAEMTFTIATSNITATTVDVTVEASTKDKTFVSNALSAAIFDKESENNIIQMILQATETEDLVKEFEDYTLENLTPDTEYVVYALGVEGNKATTKLATKRFKTLKAGEQPTPQELTFELTVSDIRAHGAAIDIRPSDEQALYVADIVMKSEFNGMTNEQIIASLLPIIEEGDAGSGAQHVSADVIEQLYHLTADTDYVLFAFGVEHGKATSDLYTADFRTLKDDATPEPGVKAPEVEFIGGINEGQFFFAARCATMDASEAYIGLFDEGAYSEMTAQGIAMKDVFDNIEGYMTFSEQTGWLDQLNSENGIGLSAGAAAEGVTVEAFLKVVNKDGGANVRWANTRNEQKGWSSSEGENAGGDLPAGGAINAELVGGINDGNYFFGAVCHTQNAAEAYIALFDGGAYESVKAQGDTLETVFELFQTDAVVDFSQQGGWLDYLNSKDGIGLNAGPAQEGVNVEAFLKILNGEGDMVVLWADTTGAKDAWSSATTAMRMPMQVVRYARMK